MQVPMTENNWDISTSSLRYRNHFPHDLKDTEGSLSGYWCQETQ